MNRAHFAADLGSIFYASGPHDGGAPAGLPDWEDSMKTANDRAPYALEDTPAVEKSASHVWMRDPESTTREASTFIDAMGELQLNLQMSLLCLGDQVDGVPYDRSAHAAAETLRTRIQELNDLRDALNELYMEAADPAFVPLFAEDAPLVAYVKGVYLWCDEVTTALADVAAALRVLQPDWLELRQRIERASMWYFDGLPNEIRSEMERAPVRPELAAKIEEVFFAARFLAHGLEKRFG